MHKEEALGWEEWRACGGQRLGRREWGALWCEVEARRGWEGPAMQVFRTETELILGSQIERLRTFSWR